ncbi:hypothetical protein ATO10_11367 [Actibacterium atlanticum]|uniref:Uncharacterized protein n=1 Tax=Actibacterium atlanticum TaxID=1461693 RepID=A0A058ZIV4_9RHOB|nr:hypothetical protein [Actibacterium atlanticum]KCV81508.1 hypothetical protein ATO10_11367 [Actibacterium atlanticum]
MALRPARRPSISKSDAVISQLEAAVLLLLRGFDPIPVHTLVWASRTVLNDLNKIETIPILDMLDDAVLRRVEPGFVGEWKRHQNRAANFFKHADRDPDETLEGVNLDALNSIELLICILATQQLAGEIPRTLACGLTYLGHRSGRWFDFRGYCEDVLGGTEHYDSFRRWRPEKQREIALGAFERAYMEQNWSGLRVPTTNPVK